MKSFYSLQHSSPSSDQSLVLHNIMSCKVRFYLPSLQPSLTLGIQDISFWSMRIQVHLRWPCRLALRPRQIPVSTRILLGFVLRYLKRLARNNRYHLVLVEKQGHEIHTPSSLPILGQEEKEAGVSFIVHLNVIQYDTTRNCNLHLANRAITLDVNRLPTDPMQDIRERTVGCLFLESLF